LVNGQSGAASDVELVFGALDLERDRRKNSQSARAKLGCLQSCDFGAWSMGLLHGGPSAR
jgi:hypothetical protein